MKSEQRWLYTINHASFIFGRPKDDVFQQHKSADLVKHLTRKTICFSKSEIMLNTVNS
jgi:hypothetical protein